ncbi:hypothetical protein GBF38_016371 [Nibea albiflora]|uniref:Uncharacterized protein n=1 Tax=Nibea albiflora TaxID=240163 RepID=A0ACB7FI03_NIBAL|nr:hypothetical protein GBF38_016371 [Nibea albiflora]
MRSSLVLAALLCFTTWMSMANANHGMGGQWCCIQWSTTKVPAKLIANYTIQPEGVCPVRAIM